jgi:predicted transcriptional regulator with HTH domain
LKKYIQDEDINEDVDNIITTLNELYDNYKQEKGSNSFDIVKFSRNNVRKMFHLPDKIEKVYKILLARAQSDIMNVLT